MQNVLDRFRGPLGILAILLILGGYLYASFERASEETLRADQQRRELLHDRIALAETMLRSRSHEDQGRLDRLRLEIRSGIRWTADHLARDGTLWLDPDASSFSVDTDGRRLHGIIRRTLDDWEGALAVEMLVASDQGIWTHRAVARGMSDLDRQESKRTHQTLWYAPEVQRAISASGRRAHSGEIQWEAASQKGENPTSISRLAIALHGPGEVVQGVLVASFDVEFWANNLEVSRSPTAAADDPDSETHPRQSGAPRAKLALASTKGQFIGPKANTEAFKFADLEIFIPEQLAMGTSESADRIERLGQTYLSGNLISHREEDPAALYVMGRVAAPSQGWLAWWQAGWGYGVLAWFGMAIIYVLSRRTPEASGIVQYEILEEESNAATQTRSAGHLMTAGNPQRFQTREWLGDVRSCLERDAATRGLALSLRCDHQVAAEIVSDATRLGGLVVAMGRSALLAAGEDRIQLDVRAEESGRLRFEIDSFGDRLVPQPGMRKAAAGLGAEFVDAEGGRLAFLIPENPEAEKDAEIQAA